MAYVRFVDGAAWDDKLQVLLDFGYCAVPLVNLYLINKKGSNMQVLKEEFRQKFKEVTLDSSNPFGDKLIYRLKEI